MQRREFIKGLIAVPVAAALLPNALAATQSVVTMPAVPAAAGESLVASFFIKSKDVALDPTQFVTGSIADMGNGWYRVEQTIDSYDGRKIPFEFERLGNTSMLWGGQVSYDIPEPYIPTISRRSLRHIMGKPPNLLLHSQDFGSKGWRRLRHAR